MYLSSKLVLMTLVLIFEVTQRHMDLKIGMRLLVNSTRTAMGPIMPLLYWCGEDP